MIPPAEQPPKTFTVAEANTIIPTVRTLVNKLQQLQRSISQTNARIDELTIKVSAGNGYPIDSLKVHLEELAKRQLDLIEAFQTSLQSLHDLGCELKDLNAGLVDFYGMREGELIYLCWKAGEEQLRFWHTLDDGYAGRQPLE